MNNQTIDVIEKRDIDRIFFSITIISQQIFFNDGNGYIYKRNIDILIGCNINGVRKYITSVFDDEFTKTSDWYNLFLNFKSKGLKNAFFIITDPVTNAGTSKGRIYFSILVAFLIVILRAFGSYSDAVAFAVMLSNAAAPLIDVLTHRRPFGYRYKKGGLQ